MALVFDNSTVATVAVYLYYIDSQYGDLINKEQGTQLPALPLSF